MSDSKSTEELRDKLEQALAGAYHDRDHGDMAEWRVDELIQLFDQELAKHVEEARQTEVQTISNKLVELGVPVLDYLSDDNYSDVGRFLNERYHLNNQTKEKQ